MGKLSLSNRFFSALAARPIAIISLLVPAGGMSPALAQEHSTDSAELGVTPMHNMDMAPHQTGQIPVAPAEKASEQSPFIRDSKFSGVVRTYYFNRDNFNPGRNEAWAIGGWLTYQSGYLADFLHIGATAYTSQPLYAPGDLDTTLLLKPRRDGYTVLGQIYAEVKFADRVFGAIGRKEYETPYMNKNDTRMSPNTFEGVTAYGRAGAGAEDGAPQWHFGGGYITRIKQRNSDEFVWMSRAAGARADRGVYVAGGNVEHKDVSFGAINYYSEDIINIFYTEAAYGLKLTNESKLRLSAQFSNQGSVGGNLLTGEAFSNHQWGIKSDLSAGSALFTLAYTDTAGGDDMRNPWSGYPGYTLAQVQEFNRSGESALMLRGSYDFSKHGAAGVSAYALWVHGGGRLAPAFNEDEYDLNVQWTPTEGKLKGASFRMRYARVSQRGGDPAIYDFRIIANYNF